MISRMARDAWCGHSKKLFVWTILLCMVILFCSSLSMFQRNLSLHYIHWNIPLLASSLGITAEDTTVDTTMPEHESDIEEIRVCSQKERINYMKEICRLYNTDDTMKRHPKINSIFDFERRLHVCVLQKAGGNMVRGLMMAAKGRNLTNISTSVDPKFFFEVTKYGMGLSQDRRVNISDDEAVNYFNIMVIRHPFDILLSYYRDKIAQAGECTNPGRRKAIMKEFHPEVNITEHEIFPTFVEFITYMYRHKIHDAHWVTVWKACHPCFFSSSAVLRTETLSQDFHVLKEKLHYNGSLQVYHSHQSQLNYSQFSKVLHQYNGVSSEVIDYFLDMFNIDMSMFGYSWDKVTNTAICAINTTDHSSCC